MTDKLSHCQAPSLKIQDLGFTIILATHVIKHLLPDEIEGLRMHAKYEVDEICKILTI